MARVWSRVRRSAVTTNATLTAGVETIIATVAGINAQGPNQTIGLRGFAQITGAAGTTSVTLRVRRGSAVTDTLVGEGNAITPVAANTVNADIDTQDTPGEVASQTYVLTATAAGADATLLQAELAVTID